ncbi:MAG: aquaporin Z [Planctomycetaceae bacterium]|nr:aquaporin Z [Planctomycetaceae bacterium]
MRALIAEFIGTFWLVLGGCGAAVFAAQHIGFHGVALAFGLSVLTMAFAISRISGCHLNPAVTCGLAAGGRFPVSRVLFYIVAQCLGAIAAAAVIYVILTSSFGTGAVGGFAANGYGDLSPDKYTMLSALVCEIVMTFMFVMVIMGATDARVPAGFAPIAIGLCLTLVHLVSIPVTNTSVNPARSLSQALFAGGPYISQLWLFWLAPIVGGVLAGIVYRTVFEQDK